MRILKFLFILLMVPVYGQEHYDINNIPEPLRTNVNAIIRDHDINIALNDVNNMTVSYHIVVTVLNKRGLEAIQPAVGYDANSSVQSVSARVYDARGKEIRKYKKKDFSDVSATGANLYSDNRMMVLDFTPSIYPFTFEFETITKTNSTAFIPRWLPIAFTSVSVESSSYILRNPRRIPLNSKIYNLDAANIEISETGTEFRYSLKNQLPVKKEDYGPYFTEIVPFVKIAPQQFTLAGTRAEVRSWKDFGYWQQQKLLNGRGELSESTIGRISALVSGINDPKEKARAIYEFMQSKTRYISVQIGIGGWQPTFASEVDELGYGDCKGLTNYTQALLKSQGIESYYTIVDSGPGGQDIDEDFVALQGDHVILTVPFEDENVFLECTSQQLPFNFLGTHTDDRKVLMVTPEGGVMTRTHRYSPEDNKIELKANVTLQESLKLSGTLTQRSSGIQYSYRYDLENETSDDVKNRYKRYWSHLNNLDLADISFSNDKKEVEFTESLWFETEGYVSMAGSRILLNPNIFQRIEDIPSKAANRTQPLVIRRGFTETDSITLLLPSNYVLESVFEPISITTKFGTYRSSVNIVNEATIEYKREFILNTGRYPKEDFNTYADFIKDVVRSDRSKIVFVQK